MRFFNVPYRVFALALFSVGVVVMCAWIMVVNLPILAALDERGETTTAKIVWKSEPYRRWLGRQRNSGGVRQDIRYGFFTETGQWIEDTVNKRERYAHGLTVGRTFPITYLPDRPKVFHSELFKGYAGVGMVKALLILGAFTAMVTLYLVWRMPREWPGPRLWPMVSFGHTEWWDRPSA